MKRDLERARKVLRDAINRDDAPYTQVYIARTQAKALLDTVDAALTAPTGRYASSHQDDRGA